MLVSLALGWERDSRILRVCSPASPTLPSELQVVRELVSKKTATFLKIMPGVVYWPLHACTYIHVHPHIQ